MAIRAGAMRHSGHHPARDAPASIPPALIGVPRRGTILNRASTAAPSRHVAPDLRVLFVGINPGIRSATLGHHFAGYANTFWKLLYDARLVPEPIGTEQDARLLEWGYGITNLIPRPTAGIDTLRPSEYAAGLVVLRRKVRRWKPAMVAFVGVSLYRVIFKQKGPVSVGLQRETFESARVFVLPNPSGRNAHFSYAEMRRAFRTLKAVADR